MNKNKEREKRLKEIGMTEEELKEFWENYERVMDARSES